MTPRCGESLPASASARPALDEVEEVELAPDLTQRAVVRELVEERPDGRLGLETSHGLQR
jgi:hypothetical protein